MAEQDMAAQVRAMRSVRDFERLKAAGAFEEMTPEVVEALFARLRPEQNRWWRRFTVLFLVVWVLAMLAGIATERWFGDYARSFGGSGLFFGVAAGVVGGSTRLRRRLEKTLDALDDVRYVGALVDALKPLLVAVRGPCGQTLARVLARVTAEDGHCLTVDQRAVLAQVVLVGPPPLASAAMAAFLRLRDPSCLSSVRQLARRNRGDRADRELTEQARAALPEFEALAAQEREHGALLRPADAPADGTLLRPAGSGAGGDETMLLRPAETGEGDAVEVTDAYV